MPILLLCRGDEQAKTLLRNAITTHYGPNPNAFESVHMQATARVTYPLGSFNIPMKLRYQISFQLPHKYREEYQIRFLNIPLIKKSETFDGQRYQEKSAFKPVLETTDDTNMTFVHQHLWTYSAMLLIPLSETYVELQQTDEYCFVASNTQTGVSATICLYDNYQLQQIIVTSQKTEDEFLLDLSLESELSNDVKMCKQIGVWRNNQFLCNLGEIRFEFNDTVDKAIFRLQ